MNKQHVQVPKMDISNDGLEHVDPYVYACIKKHMNNETKEAFPAIRTLVKESGLYKDVILNAINRLQAAGYIEIDKQFGKVNKYKFNDYKKFEIFSYDFFDNPNLTAAHKAFIVASQEYMHKNAENNTGILKLDTKNLAKAIGLSTSTLRRREKELQSLNILSYRPSTQMELMRTDNGNLIPATGLPLQYRVFHFDEFCNVLALKFNQVDNRIDTVEDRISKLERENQELKEQIKLFLQEKQSNTQIIL